MLKVENLCKKYDNKKTFALENINLTVPNNGFVSIVGSSGSGKTTLLNLLGGLDRPTNGIITLDDINITNLSNKELEEYRNKYVSFIYQDFNLLDYLSVEENASILNNCEDNIIKKLGLEELKDKCVNKLSGGEKQRVGIARALAKKPKIILADEPTGSLDSKNSEKIMDILKEISKSILVIVITHDEYIAQKYSDEIITLESSKIINKKQKIKRSDIKDENIYQLSFLNKKIEKRIIKYMIFLKPLKFILSLIMLVLMLSVLIISDSINKIDVPETMAKSVINEGDKVLYMENKYGIKSNHDKFIGKKYFGEMDLNNYNNEKNVISLYANYDEYIKDLEQSAEKDNMITDIQKYIVADTVFVISDGIFNNDIIGSIPINSNEIIITEALARSYVSYGMNLSNGINIKPKNIEEILDKEIIFGKSPVVIKGILKQEYDKYDNIKTELNNYSIINDITVEKYLQEIIEPGTFIYVTSDFEKYISNSTIYAIRDSNAKINDNNFSYNTDFTLHLKKDLEKNEIVLNYNYLDYLDKKVKITIYDKEYEMLVVDLSGENYVSSEFANNNNIMLTNYNYSTNIFYIQNYSETTEILKSIGSTFKLDENNAKRVYGLNTTYYKNIIAYDFNYVLIVGNILKYLSYIAAVIIILLIIVYVNQLISKNKKDILILKCLGINNKIIIRLYSACLAFYITLSLVISTIFSVITNIIINSIVTNNFGFYFKPLEINIPTIIFIIMMMFLILLIAIINLIRKINKTNPINLMRKV